MRPTALRTIASVRGVVIRPQFTTVRLFSVSITQWKRRSSDSKVRHREERQSRKQELEAKLDSAEQWLESHHQDYTDTIQDKRSMLLEETDPFEMDNLKSRLNDTLHKLKRECANVKQGRSDPELIRGLHVELPEQLGGRVQFTEIATVGPKPGDARSLLITIFDIEVSRLQLKLMQYTKHIVRAIAQKFPHLNPQPSAKNDSQLLIPLPPLTKQTRLDNQKRVKELGEKQKT